MVWELVGLYDVDEHTDLDALAHRAWEDMQAAKAKLAAEKAAKAIPELKRRAEPERPLADS